MNDFIYNAIYIFYISYSFYKRDLALKLVNIKLLQHLY